MNDLETEVLCDSSKEILHHLIGEVCIAHIEMCQLLIAADKGNKLVKGWFDYFLVSHFNEAEIKVVDCPVRFKGCKKTTYLMRAKLGPADVKFNDGAEAEI